jgi:hypothetical protein
MFCSVAEKSESPSLLLDAERESPFFPTGRFRVRRGVSPLRDGAALQRRQSEITFNPLKTASRVDVLRHSECAERLVGAFAPVITV